MRYIIENENEKACFYAGRDGIYKKTADNGVWSEGRKIYDRPVKDMCVKNDISGITHMLCINRQGDIIFIKNSGESHTLIKENGKVSARCIRMYEYDHRISIIYTADHGDEILLVYCILGLNAMPLTIDIVQGDDFFLYANRVYYQNKDGVLGYKDFSDGRPDVFVPVAEKGSSAHIINYCGQEIMVYKSPDGIALGGRTVIEDKYAKNPILSARGRSLLLIWESGGFIRYAESDDGGESFHTPMRFFNNSSPMEIYMIQDGDNFIYEYACEREHSIHLFAEKNTAAPSGRPEKKQLSYSVHEGRETEKLAIMVQMMKTDIAELKNRVERLEQSERGRMEHSGRTKQSEQPEPIKEKTEELPEDKI